MPVQPFVADLGTTQSSGATTIALALPVGVAVGDEIVVYAMGSSGILAINGVADNASGGSNTYTKMANSAGGSGGNAKDMEIWRSVVTNALVAANTITATFAGSVSAIMAAAVFRGVTNSTDKSHSGTGTSATPSDTLAAATADRTLAHAVLGLTSSFGAEVTINSADAEYPTLHYVQHTIATIALYTAFRVVQPSATSTYDPGISSSVNWRMVQASMPWAASASPNPGTIPTLGTG